MEPIRSANNNDNYDDNYDVYSDYELMQTALDEIRRCNALRHTRASQRTGIVPFSSPCIHVIDFDWDRAMQPPL